MASNTPSEQELQFRKSARRRLIGAIALVLLMVTVLPMVLDEQSDSQPQPDIAITIPNQDDSDFTSRVVPEAAPVNVPPPAETAPAPQDQPLPAPVEPPPVEAAPVVETPPAAPAKVESAKVEPAKPASSPATRFVVQIGVYSDPANVKKLQEKLAAQGLKTFTQEIKAADGSKVRLRMGPFDSRRDADKALGALKAAGMQGIIVSE